MKPIPPAEIFDVVDDHDQVIGAAPRNEVHRLGLRHRAVHVLVRNERDAVFLQKRSMRKDCFPGTWDSSASGHLDQGETYDDCALRELAEELGLRLPTPPIRLFKVDACPQTGQEFCWVYHCRHAGPFQLQPEEIEEGRWVEPAEIDRWILARPEDFAPAFVLIWDRIRRDVWPAIPASQPESHHPPPAQP